MLGDNGRPGDTVELAGVEAHALGRVDCRWGGDGVGEQVRHALILSERGMVVRGAEGCEVGFLWERAWKGRTVSDRAHGSGRQARPGRRERSSARGTIVKQANSGQWTPTNAVRAVAPSTNSRSGRRSSSPYAATAPAVRQLHEVVNERSRVVLLTILWLHRLTRALQTTTTAKGGLLSE
jgi:hypothetical protein